MRETAYGTDVRIAYEMLTGNRDRLLAKRIDKLLGHLDMLYNGDIGAAHPFMVGLVLETVIHYYDMTVAEGHPDYRVPPVVKRALDALWRDYYVASTHAFRYTHWDIPTVDTWSVLNDLVAPAYAWYWNHTGDAASLSRGDDLFQHTFDVPGDVTWYGKGFSQIYKWSFDYVRWRSGVPTSTIAKDNNPFGGPYPDTEPPIETQVAVGNITDTTATITWKTYENANSQIIYGYSSGYYPWSSPILDSGSGMKQTHSITLTGLQPGVTYHYRVDSRDAASNLASLADQTFNTTGTPGGGGGGTVNRPNGSPLGSTSLVASPTSRANTGGVTTSGSSAAFGAVTSSGTLTSAGTATTAGSTSRNVSSSLVATVAGTAH